MARLSVPDLPLGLMALRFAPVMARAIVLRPWLPALVPATDRLRCVRGILPAPVRPWSSPADLMADMSFHARPDRPTIVLLPSALSTMEAGHTSPARRIEAPAAPVRADAPFPTARFFRRNGLFCILK